MTARIRHTPTIGLSVSAPVVTVVTTCRRRESNPDSPCGARDFKSCPTQRHQRQAQQNAATAARNSGKSGACGNSSTQAGTDSPHVSPALILAAVRRARGARR